MRIRNILKRLAICFLSCSIPFVLVGCQQKSQEISFRDIKSEGELIVLTNAYFEPYEYYKNNEIVGVDISIAKLIAERLGLKLKIKDMDFDNILIDLTNNKGHIAMAGITLTEEREKAFAHSIPYAESSQRILINANIHSDIKKLDDLVGKKIGVVIGTTSDVFISQQIKEGSFADSETETIVAQYKDLEPAKEALENGDIDAFILDSLTAQRINKAHPNLVVLAPILSNEEYVFVYNKNMSQEFINIIDNIIIEIKRNGTLDSFYEDENN